VLLEEGDHERTDRQHLEAARAGIVERERDQPAADALAFEGRRNLGVQERDQLGLRVIVEKAGKLGPEVRLVAPQLGVVA